ncbi:hypothetical protein [Nesterenkonia haasae]|uniref:hypothetical protein n=1 Tax=Nesterenkonia haasae TaxID=2587813 RepID=UPI001F490BB9|nr:hypothetical protein [Nesterenkonia haasae]NDK30610.1 hypothetical protein [Nesterenkonia haasae]
MTIDPVCDEVVELQPFNAVLSKEPAQVRRNLDRFEGAWRNPASLMSPKRGATVDPSSSS